MSRLRLSAAAAMLWCVVAGCAHPTTPAQPLQFAISGYVPRVMWISDQIEVPVEVSNTGTRAWDPANVHLSYHWRWLVPRELFRPNQPVPFQEGIRTDFPAPVPAGARSPVQGRILAPTVPGLYWLEWDMVEEHVTWFGQVVPRQPWRLTIVLPPLAAALAPFPLIFAIVGIGLLRRMRRGQRVLGPLAAFAITADVWWCAAVLWAKPIELADAAVLNLTDAGQWLTAAGAVLLPIVLLLVLPRRARGWILAVIGVFVTLIIVGDVIYFRFFGDLLSAPALLGVNQTGEVTSSIRELWSSDLTWMVMDLPFAIWLTIQLARLRTAYVSTRARAVMAGVAVAALSWTAVSFSAPSALAATSFRQVFANTTVANKLGPLGYHVYDIWNYTSLSVFRPRASSAELDAARAWFEKRAALRAATGPFAGIAAKRNLIIIQVESLQNFAVDFQVGGQEVMPHLRRWVDGGVRFTRVTDQTNEGRTSDAEFTAMTSLLPLEQGAVAFHYPGNRYVGVAHVLAEHGYHTLSAIPYHPGFWNRAVTHPAYGFQQSLFEDDFGKGERIGWGLNDRDFLLQMVPRLEAAPRPFAAWLITLSLHHPYDEFPEAHKVLKLGKLEGTPLGNYLHAMHYFDDALDQFRSALARDGLLADTVIALYGDHDAGFPHTDETAATIGFEPSLSAWTLFDRVPFFIRVPAPAEGSPVPTGTRDMMAGQTDFGPTLLGLLGIDAAALPYVGRNLLGNPGDPPLVRPRGNWLDAHHLFFAGNPDYMACFDVTATAYDARAACDDEDARAQAEREMSHLVIISDLQEELRNALRASLR